MSNFDGIIGVSFNALQAHFKKPDYVHIRQYISIFVQSSNTVGNSAQVNIMIINQLKNTIE